MGRRMLGVVLVAMVLAMSSMASADVFVLKEGMGPLNADNEDTGINWSGTEPHNYGRVSTIRLSSKWYVGVIKFDLDAIPLEHPVVGVDAVNSAILRLYQTGGSSGTDNVNARRLTEGWDEGVAASTHYSETFAGANAYMRRAGTHVKKDELNEYEHSGTTVYYTDGVTDLAQEPVGGDGHALRGYYRTSYDRLRNFDVARRLFREATDLDDLITKSDDDDNRHYWYDEGNDRLYVRTNDYGFVRFGEADLWADAIWDGDTTKAPSEASLDPDEYKGDAVGPEAWIEIDVTGMAEEWLVDELDNFGMRVKTDTYNMGYVASSDARMYDPVSGKWFGEDGYEENNGINVHPELVLDLELQRIVPEPAGLSLLGLALLGIRRRKRS